MRVSGFRLCFAMALACLCLVPRVRAAEDYSTWAHSAKIHINTTAAGANVPRAIGYFLRPRNLIALGRSLIRTHRFRTVAPVMQHDGERGYPSTALDQLRERPPNLLRRKYWSTRLSFERRPWPHLWW